MISSIPSTIVLPLQDRGTPAGPNFIDMVNPPAEPIQMVHVNKSFSLPTTHLKYSLLKDITKRPYLKEKH